MAKRRKRRTTKEFIQDCSKIHNNFYDYSLVIYTTMHNKIEIICPVQW